jgi:NAD(P)-dependent dehydrogenase (short-subunit alcohol dehydrogenase family)
MPRPPYPGLRRNPTIPGMTSQAIITAGSAGIGFETARGLLRSGYAVTIIARDEARGASAVRTLRDEIAGAEVRFLAADLSSLGTVRDLGARLAQEGPLQLLVNNAGGMFAHRWETADGLEASFVLNHLTPYLLTSALTGVLAAGAPSRVVQVTSSAMMAAVPDFADVEVPGEHYGLAVTGRAKLANLSWALDVADDLHERGITLVVADPGPAATPNAAAMEIRMLPPAMRSMWDVIQQGVQRPAAEAARPILHAATAPDLSPGTLVDAEQLRQHVTPEVTKAVRDLTERLLGPHA